VRLTACLALLGVLGLLVLPACSKALQAQSRTNSPATPRGSVVILSPQDGSVFPEFRPIPVRIVVRPGRRGDHIHLLLDRGLVVMLPVKEAFGFSVPFEISYTLRQGILAGPHTLTAQLVGNNHAPTGIEASVRLTGRKVPD